MADEQINLKIQVEGGEQAARSVEGVTTALHHNQEAAHDASTATEETAQSFQELTRGGAQVIQRVQGIAGSVQGLVSALGSSDRTAGLISSVAGTTAQFASMGAMLGPGGAVLGAVVGFGTSLYGLAQAHDAAREAAENQTEEVDDLAASYRGLGAAILEWGEALGVENAARAGGAALGGLSSSDLETQARERRERLLELRVDEAESGALTRSEEEIRLRRELAGLEEEIARREADDPPTTSRGGGRAASGDSEFRGAAMTEEALDLYTSDVSDAELARRAEADAEYAAQADALAEDEIERLAAEGDAQAELFQLKADLREEDLEAERDKQDYLAELEEEAAERRETEINNLLGFVQRGSKALTASLAAIATGSKTSDEAFKGMLASFLEMISEYASMKAATEFADAASSFARYDFGGGAAHIGAGLAFTAVAVATGVGAAVINAPPTPPAKPAEREMSGASSGNVTNVINWNSPVVTAGTRAELGRELGSIMSEAGAA